MITDRYVDSSLAYQGTGRSIDVAELEHVLRWATGDLRPHLTVLLDVEPTAGLARFEERDRIEAESLDFHERARQTATSRSRRPTPSTTWCSMRVPSATSWPARIRVRVEGLLS